MQKNFIIIISLIIFITIAFVIFFNKENTSKIWIDILARSCNIYSRKNGRFPNNLDEVGEGGDIRVPIHYLKNITYSLTPDGNDGIVTTKLLFGRKYSAICSEGKFDNF